MRRKQLARCLWVILFALLAACGAAPTPKVDNADATKIVATFMAQITQTAAAAGELPATLEPTETESPEETETPAPTSTPDPYKALLDRFRMVSVIKGNLFVRDGTGLPVQITKSGSDHDPVISADGQKIAFYRGEGFQNIFVISADGSDELAVINKDLLPELGKGMAKFLTFRPETLSDFLFSSYFCENSVCGSNIFIVRAASAKITKLVSGLTAPATNDSNFAISPDGQYLSVTAPKQIDLYMQDGKLVHPNIVSVSPGKSSLPLQYWLPDSSGLVVLAEMKDKDMDGNWRYEIWRYTLPGNKSEQLPFGPPIMRMMGAKISCGFSISPDRNWIFYQKSENEYHLDNLKDAQTKVYAWDGGCATQWSPDSLHFASPTTIGSVDNTPPITLDGHFIAWLDATHYLFTKGKSILDLQSYIAEVGKEADAVQTNFTWSPVYAVLEPGP